jgi:hypothetical protein
MGIGVTSFLRFCAMWSCTVTLSRVFGRYLSTHSIFAAPSPPNLASPLERERFGDWIGLGGDGGRESGGNSD